MFEIKKSFTSISEVARQRLGITRDEYALCSYIAYRIADPRQRIAGWCCDPKEEIAAFVGVTRAGLYKMAARLIVEELIEAGGAVPFVWKVTAKWIDTENDCKQSLHDGVNKVDTRRKQSLHDDVNKVDTHTKVEYDISKNKEREVEEKTTPPPAENLSLEAEKEKFPPVAPAPPAERLQVYDCPGCKGGVFPPEGRVCGFCKGEGVVVDLRPSPPPAAPTRVTMIDPAMPGAKMLDIVGEPKTQPPPQRIGLGERATAETPMQLQQQMLAFYNDPNWQGEWLDGVWRINGVWIPDNAEKQKKLENILLDFCCHTVKKNGGRDTYRELNAGFQQWVRNEKNAFWKQKAAQGQVGQKAVYTQPDLPIYTKK